MDRLALLVDFLLLIDYALVLSYELSISLRYTNRAWCCLVGGLCVCFFVCVCVCVCVCVYFIWYSGPAEVVLNFWLPLFPLLALALSSPSLFVFFFLSHSIDWIVLLLWHRLSRLYSFLLCVVVSLGLFHFSSRSQKCHSIMYNI
jgi:hypothetical protein